MRTATIFGKILCSALHGLLAQLARAPRLHRGGRGSEPLTTHHFEIMNIELEAKWLEIDHDEFREKLKAIGAELVAPKRQMIRAVFDFPDKRLSKIRGWVRVRAEGDRITISYKQNDTNKLDGTKEVCLVVDNFDSAIELLKSIGLQQKSFQETKRESWKLDGVEIDLDEWPWLPPFIEIEAPNEEKLNNVVAKLGLSFDNAMYGSADHVYAKYYDVTTDDVNLWPEIKFSETPEWLKPAKNPKNMIK